MTIHIDRAGVTTPSEPIEPPPRALLTALSNGLRRRCPACATGRLYSSYLKVSETCPHCAEPLHHHRADDAPPYFTMLIVGHVIVAGVLALEQTLAPPYWLHLLLWLPMVILLSLWLLPRIKGMLIALQWALRMHGFALPGELDPGAPERIDA